MDRVGMERLADRIERQPVERPPMSERLATQRPTHEHPQSFGLDGNGTNRAVPVGGGDDATPEAVGMPEPAAGAADPAADER